MALCQLDDQEASNTMKARKWGGGREGEEGGRGGGSSLGLMITGMTKEPRIPCKHGNGEGEGKGKRGRIIPRADDNWELFDCYLLFDFSGQVELFFLHSNAKNVIMKLMKKLNLRLSTSIFTEVQDLLYLEHHLDQDPHASNYRTSMKAYKGATYGDRRLVLLILQP
ncbi:uncharacterized protein LOC110661215 [Hevea brasiliensis]|uniref:uncharacterized protein LOC110661215 n=1 Tax=Hevea brasiliensis TaxID=3981 RepID=UPI0025D8F1F8|nr:uncharacterized protein LOC110661215 [Hevea brasiliensis]